MNKKFPYGHEINNYINKSLEIMKEIYPWIKLDMYRKEWTYQIEKINNRYQYVTYFHWSDGNIERKVVKCNGKEFVDLIIEQNKDYVEYANPIKDTFKVPIKCGININGWYLERYEFNKHSLGGYSAFVQAGDRTTGGSRTFFIPPSYFKENFLDFLDKYSKLVPGYAFGFDKEDLEKVPGLKEFLGF